MVTVSQQYIFCATIHPSTPLKYLKMHGAVSHRRPASLPSAHGMWLSALPGQTEFYGEMSSAIGPIPADGGEFLLLLIEAKTIAATKEPVALRRLKLKELADQPRWLDLMRKIGWSSITSLCDR